MALLVLHPGLSTTLQDGGRPRFRHLGVPQGGAADRESWALANALLGNPFDTASLELTQFGGSYQALEPLELCLVGARFDAKVTDDGQVRFVVEPAQSFAMRPGDRLEIGGCRRGCRGYLAVAGGWLTPSVLESRSSESKLKAGETLAASPTSVGRLRRRLGPGEIDSLFDENPIRLMDGPDAREVPERSAELFSLAFRVGLSSDRLGMRLESEHSTPASIAADRPSSPVVPGAIQWSGAEWIALGPAGGTIGGYLHVGQVISCDLDRLFRRGPGELVRFEKVSRETARDLDRNARERLTRRLTLIRLACSEGR